jgi:hypothetical protein
MLYAVSVLDLASEEVRRNMTRSYGAVVAAALWETDALKFKNSYTFYNPYLCGVGQIHCVLLRMGRSRNSDRMFPLYSVTVFEDNGHHALIWTSKPAEMLQLIFMAG